MQTTPCMVCLDGEEEGVPPLGGAESRVGSPGVTGRVLFLIYLECLGNSRGRARAWRRDSHVGAAGLDNYRVPFGICAVENLKLVEKAQVPVTPVATRFSGEFLPRESVGVRLCTCT